MRRGYKTTEYWLAVAAAGISLAMASGAFAVDGQIMRGLALIAAALASAGYSYSRAAVKAGGDDRRRDGGTNGG